MADPQLSATRIARFCAALTAIPFFAYACWRTSTLFAGSGILKNYVLLPIPLVALCIATVILALALARTQIARRIITFAVVGGVTVGGVGFFGGFVLPILLNPGANQGPLLGILFTGPIGFVLGVVGGVLVALRRKQLPPLPR